MTNDSIRADGVMARHFSIFATKLGSVDVLGSFEYSCMSSYFDDNQEIQIRHVQLLA